ncbi:GH14237 [Drosophila grimshawi]|uniref:GH14237 n=2 Tax=Drosophila grimshawi TaxID=7222 RepID=B4JY69_DROGR|nr:GH14237 [Drosophila grimshawi]
MMQLVLLFLLLLQVVAHASVAATNATCKHATNMWGDPNPNIFYVCNTLDQRPLQLHCPQGRGFFNGLGHLGCLPYDQWPACRPNATQLTRSCSREVEHPWASIDPNQFYMCPGADANPILLNCAAGRAFIQSVGCSADWSHWRRHMHCESFF